MIGQTPGLQGLDQGVGGQLPVRVAADGFFRPGGELHFVLKPEDGHDLEDEVQDPDDFALHLSGRAEDMGVVLGELAHPGEAVQHPGALVAQHRAQLEVAQRQVPVAADPGLVDQHVGQAVHGLDAVHLAFDFGEIHVVPVVVPMAGAFPEVRLEHLGAHDHLVAPLEMLPALEILDEAPQQGPFGMVDDHARPRLRLRC